MRYANLVLNLLHGNHPDFYLIEGENGSIKIDQIRQMQENISQKPIISSKKVYIIKDSEQMTKEAGNCMLKTLEEPPQYATIILITANETKLLNTIKSRCMKVAFNTIPEEKIQRKVYELLGVEPEKELIQKSGGSLGRALRLQEQKELYNSVNEILKNLETSNLINILNNSEVLYKEKENIQEILEYIVIYLYNTKDIKKIDAIKYVEEAKKRINANSNYDMSIDYLLMNLWEEINEKHNRSAI